MPLPLFSWYLNFAVVYVPRADMKSSENRSQMEKSPLRHYLFLISQSTLYCESSSCGSYDTKCMRSRMPKRRVTITCMFTGSMVRKRVSKHYETYATFLRVEREGSNHLLGVCTGGKVELLCTVPRVTTLFRTKYCADYSPDHVGNF